MKQALRKIREVYWLYLTVLALCLASCLTGIFLMWAAAMAVVKVTL